MSAKVQVKSRDSLQRTQSPQWIRSTGSPSNQRPTDEHQLGRPASDGPTSSSPDLAGSQPVVGSALRPHVTTPNASTGSLPSFHWRRRDGGSTPRAAGGTCPGEAASACSASGASLSRGGSMESSLELSGSLGSVSSLLARCRTFKVLVIGDSGVGKTCLTCRLCAGDFPTRVEATIGVDFHDRALDVDGEKIKLQLWDTAGQERFRKSMVQHYYRNVHAVLFIYDVTCPSSFYGLNSWMEECRQNSIGQEIPRFLVGNKSDLRDPHSSRDHVSQDRAKSFAKAHGMMFFETSAKNPSNKCLSGRQGDGTPYRWDTVEDIVVAVGARLRRQSKPSAANALMYSGSFKLLNNRRPEKELWTCC